MKFPPEKIWLNQPADLVLSRAKAEHAEMIARAVGESVAHLHRFMPWSRDAESADPNVQRVRLQSVSEAWERQEEFQYVLTPVDRPEIFAASIGMMTRLGPGTIELGYWVHPQFEGRGYIRASCTALIDTAFGLDGVGVIYICCSPENTRSMAIARALGFTEDGPFDHPISGVRDWRFSKRRAS